MAFMTRSGTCDSNWSLTRASEGCGWIVERSCAIGIAQEELERHLYKFLCYRELERRRQAIGAVIRRN